MISDDGSPKIGDFGLASSGCLGSDVTYSFMERNPQWASRELVFKEEVIATYASDVWAFGMFMIEVKLQFNTTILYLHNLRRSRFLR